MDYSKVKFRCSSLGLIMTEAKGESNIQAYERMKSELSKAEKSLGECSEAAVKTANKLYDKIENLKIQIDLVKPWIHQPHLSETCKKYLSDVSVMVNRGRTKDVKSKYLKKGLHLEEDAITQYCLLPGNGFHKKNKERRFNDWIEGECDIAGDNFIVDTKVSWDIFTYNNIVANDKSIDEHYNWQLDGYMWLWGKERAELAYCLLNTPKFLLEKEERKLLYDMFGSDANYACSSKTEKENFEDALSDLRKNHIYDDIPLEEKVRIFRVNYSEERIEKIKSRVEECRNWMNQNYN